MRILSNLLNMLTFCKLKQKVLDIKSMTTYNKSVITLMGMLKFLIKIMNDLL